MNKLKALSIGMLSLVSLFTQAQDLDPLSQNLEELENIEASISQLALDPIYINGVIHKLTKADFVPVYKTIYYDNPCLGAIRRFVGYKTSIPVIGDYGQNLVFELSGRSAKSMKLTASCGNFSGTDTGSKYVISKSMSTNQTCENMVLEFSVDDYQQSSTIDLNVLIAESF
ncbi:hypothetical protein [Thalassomonas sp. RHCl1]|uniref:hypothetical protein n=1 Tax=Thalassomonas sp. RHCl1 TaxID=2995320 RepID=UPI00248BC215|nr:hypothetical protein [Thalassomonas sp. RHCl1]